MIDLSQPAAALGIGVALGAAPGPVQVLILAESAHGGARRGLHVVAGVNVIFIVLLLGLEFGLASLEPAEAALDVLRLAGGAFLLWLSLVIYRESRRPAGPADARRTRLHPFARGVLAVMLNPGVWIFLATTASAVIADAEREGGHALGLLTAAAMVVGALIPDMVLVAVGSGGATRLGEPLRRRLEPVLAAGLAAFGILLLYQAAA